MPLGVWWVRWFRSRHHLHRDSEAFLRHLNDWEQAAVVVSPEAKPGWNVDRLTSAHDRRVGKKFGIGRDQNPFRLQHLACEILGRADANRLHAGVAGELVHHGCKRQEPIRDVKRDDPARSEVAAIDLERLHREEMRGNGVSGKRIDDQDVIPLRRFGGERDARVAADDLHERG